MVPKVAEVLDAISDDISFNMLDIIIRDVQTIDSLTDKLNVSSKQCYDRIVKFLDNGLIKRKGMNYVITSFGRLVFEAQLKVAKAVQNLSKLKVIDAVRNGDISRDEYATLIDELIEDNEIKNIILYR
jgi:DNA-binding Lrp family transcriptional regulator